MNVLEMLKINLPTLERSRETVSRLREEKIFVAAALTEAEAELAGALLAKAERITDGEGIPGARKRVADGKQQLREIELALVAAECRLEAAEGDDAAKELAKRQKQIKKLCEHRHGLALRFQKLAVELAVVVDQIEDSTSDIFSLVPGKTDMTAALLNRADLYNALQEQIRRVDASPWSAGPFGAWELERRPDLVARVEAANAVLGA